jgi:hypothetical protein
MVPACLGSGGPRRPCCCWPVAAGCSRIPTRKPRANCSVSLSWRPLAAPRSQTTTNHISVASSGEAEAGVTVRVAPDIRHPVIVRFAYRDAAPLNLRVNSGDKFEYLSASSESILLLGRGQASEALFLHSRSCIIRHRDRETSRNAGRTISSASKAATWRRH